MSILYGVSDTYASLLLSLMLEQSHEAAHDGVGLAVVESVVLVF